MRKSLSLIAACALIFSLPAKATYYDPETGTFYNYSRDLDPTTGRYLQSDPIGLAAKQFSTYAYVGGNPLMNADPYGLQAISPGMVIPEPAFPAAPPALDPKTKSYLCDMIKNCRGDVNCLFNRVNKERHGNWSDPTLRNAENFATAAADGTYPFQPVWDNWVGISAYQFLWKPINPHSTPVSGDAWAAGIEGSAFNGMTPAQVLNEAGKWCDCLKK